MTMISIDKAHQIINDIVSTRMSAIAQESICMPLADALRHVLAEDVVAPMNVPQFARSTMDGYAIDVKHGAKPQSHYIVIGESRAGHGFEIPVSTYEAVKIHTGAQMPIDTNTVIPLEQVQNILDDISTITLSEEVRNTMVAQQYVRHEGSEIQKGKVVLKEGTLLRPDMLALCASMGIATVAVRKTPRIALLITGNELVDYREALPTPYHVYDANTILLESFIKQAGGTLVMSMRVGDALLSTIEALRTMQSHADVIITAGGASVGAHDVVRRASHECGFTEHFWGVQQKPGKPMFFCSQAATLLLGLPGNPVSAMICFMEYAHRLIGRLRGAESPLPKLKAILRSDVISDPERDEFIRVQIIPDGDQCYAEPLSEQHSSMLTSVATADGYVYARAGIPMIAGDQVTVHSWWV